MGPTPEVPGQDGARRRAPKALDALIARRGAEAGDSFIGPLRQTVARELTTTSLPILLVLSLLSVVTTGLAAPDEPVRMIPPALGAVAVLIGFALRRVRPLSVAVALVAAVILAVAFGMAFNGGVRAPVYVGMFAAVVGAANVFGHRTAILVGVLFAAVGGVALIAEEQGLLTVQTPSPRMVYVAYMAWLAVLVAFAAVPVRVVLAAYHDSETARRVAAEGRAREDEQRRLLLTLFDNARGAVALVGGDGNIRVANRAMTEALGMPQRELVGVRLDALPGVPADEREALRGGMARAREGGSSNHHVHWSRGDDARHLDIGLRPAASDPTVGVIVVEVRDTTEYERVRAALTVEQQRYEAVFHHASDAIFLMTGERFIACNPRTCELFACELEDIVGATPMDFSPELQPDGRRSEEAAMAYISAAFEGAPQRFDWRHRRKDGQEVDCEVTLNAVEIGGIRNVVALVRDVGERRQLEARLRHAERLDSIGQLAGGVAHDFNNLLAAIMGATDVLRTEMAPDAEADPWLSMIEEASRRAADLTQQLLSFARRGIDDLGPISVHKTIESARTLLARTIDKRVNIVLALNARADRVLGSSTALQSAVLNLGVNASHAMPDGGVFEITSRDCSLDDEVREPWLAGLAPGRYIQLTVTDTGFGIPTSVIDRIFDPFFTTKDQGKGTGLGLAAVYGTVRQLGGAITVSSEVGRGTRFDIALPVLGASVELPAVPAAALPVRGSGRILVVDDEAAVRRSARGLLESCGYRVLEAGDGAEGLRLFAHERPDLVLLDLTMPVMSGRDCFERVRDLDPRARIVVMTGYGASEDVDAMRRAGLTGMIRKPFDLGQLSRVVDRALNGGVGLAEGGSGEPTA
ncbi:MAG: PAS domain-containing sensor histidine kinase [Deltaproteobacteria bacterium]|nr:MAG: PAS domain-containing sensor histidine kinase [Deltaproteobacteria bacterium]